MVKGERPEHTGPPEFFYNEDEAKKYTNNSRMIEIQVRMGNQPATLTLRVVPLPAACAAR